jgi:acylphosphatase
VPDHVARRVTVHGRVQGVYFRDSTRQAARSAGVAGWVRNEPDGTVQAHLEGPPDAVDQMLDFLREGPRDASVTDVDVREVPPEGLRGFAVD